MPTCTYKGCTAPADFQEVELDADYNLIPTGSMYCDYHADLWDDFYSANFGYDIPNMRDLIPIPDPFEQYLLGFSGEDLE